MIQWNNRTSVWTMLGPALIAMTLTLQMKMGAFFPLAVLFSLFAIWKGKLWGSALAIGVTALVAPLHMGTWTLLFSYGVMALTLLEGERTQCTREDELTAAIAAVKEEQREIEAIHLQDKIAHEDAMEERNLEVKALLEEVDAFKRLADASQAEAEKYYAHNQTLLEGALEQERQRREVDLLRDQLKEAEAVRQELNHYRTLNYQKDLLVDHYQSMEQEEVPVEAGEAEDTLRQLQDDRLVEKGAYEELLSDYRRVIEQLQGGFGVVENLSAKREELAATRERIFRLEGEMLKTQKMLGRKTAEEGYLAIADGEVARLEEENGLLLDLIRKQETQG